jgi:hypothetical protein
MSRPADTDTIEPRAPWLSRAILEVVRLPKQLPRGPGVEVFALRLLRSVEADSLPAPEIYATGQGFVRVTWQVGKRELHLSVVGERTVNVRRKDRGRWLPSDPSITGDFTHRIRNLVAWLEPSANQSTANNLVGWRDT